MQHTIAWQGESLTVKLGRYLSPANISITLHDERGTPYAKAMVTYPYRNGFCIERINHDSQQEHPRFSE